MRNLVLLQDSIFTDVFNNSKNNTDSEDIISICRDVGSTSIFALTKNGLLYYLDTADSFRIERVISLNMNGNPHEFQEQDNSWFNITVVAETGSIVCISYSGLIYSIKEDHNTGQRSNIVEEEGNVEGGVAAACWNPDSSNLILITNNDSILLMTAYWDVLEEVPLPPRLPNSPCRISWRGDGEFVSILTVEKEDSIPHVRVYSKTLELISEGRNIAEGSGTLLKGLDNVVAYATNGSLIALGLNKGKGKHQLAFIERNGLRHLEFDIQVS